MKRHIFPTVISLMLIFYPTVITTSALFDPVNEVVEAATSESPHKVKTVWVTAYSSTPEETDDTPFITAFGTDTRDGIIAANFLPFGTKILIPDLFEDKVFVVEDRMHERKKNFIDVWMPSKELAIEFGIHQTKIIIMNQELSFATTQR
ncbi:MAG: hypothetical protein QMD65_01190 [Patescibacteria group bacterium]|nr:hypothetical protein [Patescibacteria group bacterium]